MKNLFDTLIDRVASVSNIDSLVKKYGQQKAEQFCDLRYVRGYSILQALTIIRKKNG